MIKALRILVLCSAVAALGFAALLIKYGGSTTIVATKELPALAPIADSAKNTNFTEKLSSTIARRLSDPAVAEVVQTNGSISETTIDQLIAQTMQDQLRYINIHAIRPVFTAKNIVILNPPTDASRSNYVRAYARILTDRLSEQYLKNKTTPVPSEFRALASAYKNTLADLMILPVPSDAVDIHLQTMELLGTQAQAFTILARYTDDPLKAVLTNQLQGEIVTEAGELKQKMLSYIKENNIK